MKQIAFLLLALISCASPIVAATRPQFGGTLRVAMQSAPTALTLGAASSPSEYEDMVRTLSLLGDTLVKIDAFDRIQPALAVSWQSDATARHWEFSLRPRIKFHDGSLASPAAIAQILAPLHPEWNIHASGDSLIIDCETPVPSLLAELALPRNLIFTRNSNGLPNGTGPFRIADVQPGKLLKLIASEDYWAGRPFLNSIEIEFGKSLRDQALGLELDRADVIAVAPQAGNSPRVHTSLPVELMALVFAPNSKAQDVRLRRALALSIDRKPIQSVLLKGAGEPTASILPNWMTGYSAVFSTNANLVQAKTLIADFRQTALTLSPLTLSYDPRDPQAQLIAERISLNAREAGITVQVSLSGAADIRLTRIVLPSPDPALSLREIAREWSLPQPLIHGNAVDDLYQAECALLDGVNVIPLFHLPVSSATGRRVLGWSADQLGRWNLADLWLVEPRSGESRLTESRLIDSRSVESRSAESRLEDSR